MDREEIEALELTKDDLLNKIKTGRRVNLPRKRPRDLNRQAFASVSEATAEPVQVVGLQVSDTSLVSVSDLKLQMPSGSHALS